MKYNKEELERMILKENLTYKEIGEHYGVSGVYIRKKAISLGIEVPVRHKGSREREKHHCLNCGKEVHRMARIPKYCDNKCQGEYTREKNIRYWLDNQEEYSNLLMNHSKGYIKRYLLKEQKHKCKICGCSDEWNGKLMVFVLDHIDGNAANNRRENLRLVCHNCDSQLPTYKSKNKNSARTGRYEIKEEKSN